MKQPAGWDDSPLQDTQHKVTSSNYSCLNGMLVSVTGHPALSDQVVMCYYSTLNGMLVCHRMTRNLWLRVLRIPLGWMPDQHRTPTKSIQEFMYYSYSLNCIIFHHRIATIKWLGELQLLPGWGARPTQDTQHWLFRSITAPPWMGCQTNTGYPALTD